MVAARIALALALSAAVPAAADAKAFAAWWKSQATTLARSKSASERVAVVRALALRDEPQAGELLAQLLRDGRPEVRQAAAQELADARYAPLTPRIVEALNKAQDDIEFEIELLWTLGTLADPRACDEICDSLRRPNYVRARHALIALKRIKAPTSLKTLMVFALEVLPPKEHRASRASGSWNWERHDELYDVLQDALRTISGQRLDHHEEWRSWYNDNKQKFSK